MAQETVSHASMANMCNALADSLATSRLAVGANHPGSKNSGTIIIGPYLPPELWQLVFDFCSTTAIFRMSMTTKYWSTFVWSLVGRSDPTDVSSPFAIVEAFKMLKRFPRNVHHISLCYKNIAWDSLWLEDVAKALLSLVGIRSLKVYQSEGTPTYEMLLQHLLNFTKAENADALQVMNAFAQSVPNEFRRLKNPDVASGSDTEEEEDEEEAAGEYNVENDDGIDPVANDEDAANEEVDGSNGESEDDYFDSAESEAFDTDSDSETEVREKSSASWRGGFESFIKSVAKKKIKQHYPPTSFSLGLTHLCFYRVTVSPRALYIVSRKCPNLVDIAFPRSTSLTFKETHFEAIRELPKVPWETKLYWACHNGCTMAVTNYIKNVHDVNASYRKNCMLHVAVRGGFGEIVQILVDNGAKPDMRNKMGKTCVMYSAREGHVELTQLLINMKVDLRCAIPNWLDSELGGWTALHFAVRNEHVSIAQELVAAGAPVNVVDSDGTTPLGLACQYQLVDIIDTFLQAGADANHFDKEGYTPLSITAGCDGPIEVAQALVKSGADVQVGRRPAPDCVDIDILIYNGETALHIAADTGNFIIAEYLIATGANTLAVSQRGWVPLHNASRAEVDSGIVRMLVTDFDAKEVPRDFSSLPDEGKHAKKLRWFTQLVAEWRVAPPCDRRTPLFLAAQSGALSVVRFLAQHPVFGLDLFVPCHDLLPIEIAIMLQRLDVVKYLERCMRDSTNSSKVRWNSRFISEQLVQKFGQSEQCTLLSHGQVFLTQHHWHCQTCGQTKEAEMAVCATCVRKCHVGHEIRYGNVEFYYCDCKSGKGKCNGGSEM